MNIVWAFLFLAGGLVMLWRCAHLLVTGAVELARGLGVSASVIGLTVVAMGTSAPEAAASIAAAVRDVGDVAIGNVYGSNIANLALVGGLVALILPVTIEKRMLRREMPVMLLAALLLWPVLHDLYLSRIEGLVMLAVFAGLMLLTVYAARMDKKSATANRQEKISDTEAKKNGSNIKTVLFVVVGLAGLALGADITVRGAVFIGERIGLSEAVIGLTIIAIGTSLPELVTSLAAVVRGHYDISISNLVGSNVFNTLLVVGTAGVVRPFAIVPRLAGIDYWIMVIVSAGFIGMAVVGKRIIGRAGGTLLLCTYIGYMVYLLAFSR